MLEVRNEWISLFMFHLCILLVTVEEAKMASGVIFPPSHVRILASSQELVARLIEGIQGIMAL
jgi:hypothetical protein